MPVIETRQDPDALTMRVTAEFDADPARVWQLLADPRQLEQWWGPPGWPASFGRYEFAVGGAARYHMTGPDGTKSHGWWTFTAIDPPHRLEFDDGFADADGEPIDPEDGVHATAALEQINGSRTRMTMTFTFRNREQMEEMANMGMEEGLRQAMGQIDELLNRGHLVS